MRTPISGGRRPSTSTTRRRVLAGAAGLPAGAAALRARGGQPRPPNFLYIMADDLGYADVSCYGRTDYRTPAIDDLAASGVRFTSAYANSAVCTATRVALITGRYQYRLPIGLEEPLGTRHVGVPRDQPTIASVLKAQGYVSTLIGKWHLGALPDFGPLQNGYDEFWGFRGGGVDYFTHAFDGKDLWDGDAPIERTGYLTDLLGDRTIDTIGRFQKLGRPWLVSLHFNAPHWPWEGPDDEAESKRLAAMTNPRAALGHYDGGTMATYAAMVTRMDFQVGRILKFLTAQGLDRDTVVIFTSDNGGERFSANWPFTGRKTELLEGGVRIPAIVRWPGLSKPGTVSDAQIMSMDWAPTFLAATGGRATGFTPDGIDIRSAVGGGTLPERSLYWRYKHLAQRAMRRGRMKYLEIAGNSFLFDVVADPMERGNLKARQPAVFAEMKAAWEAWNATMLPLDPQSQSAGFSPATMADHFNPGGAVPGP